MKISQRKLSAHIHRALSAAHHYNRPMLIPMALDVWDGMYDDRDDGLQDVGDLVVELMTLLHDHMEEIAEDEKVA